MTETLRLYGVDVALTAESVSALLAEKKKQEFLRDRLRAQVGQKADSMPFWVFRQKL